MAQISVIVPVYQVERYLSRCVDSILCQSYEDFELILIDDGSPDRCGAMCDEYVQRDSRVRVIHQQNGGLSAARNAGIDWVFANSHSQWLTFIDSDDWIHPDYLSALYTAALEANLPLSICSFVRTTEEDFTMDPVQSIFRTHLSEDFFTQQNETATVACAKLYHKDLFQELRFPVGRIHEDEFVTYKLLFSASHVTATDAPLYFYFRNESGITESAWSPKRLDALDAFRERLFFLKSHKLRNAYQWHVAHYWIHAESYSNHLSCLPRSEAQAYDRIITKHLRTALYHATKLQIISFRGNEHYYEKAYPFAMRLYWYWRVVCRKVSNRK